MSGNNKELEQRTEAELKKFRKTSLMYEHLDKARQLGNELGYNVFCIEKSEADIIDNAETNTKKEYGENLETIREAISKQTGIFTIPDLIKWIEIEYPNLNIVYPYYNIMMRRLIERNEVRIVERGRGRRATRYEKVSKDENK